MNRMIRISLFLALCAVGTAQMSLQVCNPNTLEPLNLSEVMVGTQVALVVASDANSIWSGGLFLRGEDRLRSRLIGRDKDPNGRDWTGSHLPDAGPAAKVTQWKDSFIGGYDLYTDELYPQPGRWFVIDYVAESPGSCTVEFYDYRSSWTERDPNLTLTLHNSPSRDFNQDQRVNMTDFMHFSKHWQHSGCLDPTSCDQTDLDLDGSVGLSDLLAFSEFWLWGNLGWQPAPPVPVRGDPNIIYQVADAYGNAQVTLNVGETATYYLYKTTLNEPVQIINLEVTISDPNLGWIDNTAYDPNNPEASGTATILAEPRYTGFDYWGPGYLQPEGIVFQIVGLDEPLPDGPVASFQYTATAAGQVTLDLINHHNDYTALLPLKIEQVAQTLETTETTMMTTSTLDSTSTSSLDTTSGSSFDPETTSSAEFLQQIYEEDAEFQQMVDPQTWDQFIEDVKQSEMTEASIQ